MTNIVVCFCAIGRIGGADAVDGSHVDKFSLRVDDKHVGSGFGSVHLTYFPRGVEEDGCGGGFLVFCVRFGLGASAVALFSWSGRDDGEPNDPFSGVLFLQGLHVSDRIVFFNEGTFRVHPLQNDKLSRVGG